MLRIALLHVPHQFVRHYARKPSPPPSKQIARITPSSIWDTYSKHCSHPILNFLNAVRASPSPSQDHALLRPPELSSQEYDKWSPVVHAPSLASALDKLEHAFTTLPVHPDSRSHRSPLLPIWVLLSILSMPPATTIEAFTAHSLALSHPPPAQPELSPLLMLLSAYWLATFRMYAPLRTIILRVIQSQHILSPYQLSLFLPILAQAPPTHELHDLLSILLDLAIRRQIDLGVTTYCLLLENRAATVRTAYLVENHMRSRAYTPNLSHSRAFLRLFGRVGKRRAAARYWRRIRLGEYYGRNPDYATHRTLQSRMLEDYLRSFKNPTKLNLYVKSLLKTTARAANDPDLKKTVRLPTLPRADGIPRQVWLHSLRTRAERLAVSADHLLSMFRAGKDHIGSPQKTLTAYFFVIKGLLKRGEHREAVRLLEEVWAQKGAFDAAKLTIAVEALTMINRPDAALRLLLDFVREPMSTYKETNEDEDARWWKSHIYNPKPDIVDTRTINSFMISLLRIGRPDAVFYIWDTMPAVFHLEPNSKTLAILLKAARFARKCEGALQVAIADFGMGRFLPKRLASSSSSSSGVRAAGAANPQRLNRADALLGLTHLLTPDDRRTVTGFWRGERAATVALRVAWQVLVGNWPVLRFFSSPFRAIRRSAGEQATKPISDLFHSFAINIRSHGLHGASTAERGVGDDGEGDQSRGEGETDGGGTGRGQAVRPYDEDGRTFFGIVPEDAVFRALFDLLAEEERAVQIPLVLTWMRYMHVWPSRDTLATVLVYWGEVTLEGPWIERMREWRARRGWEGKDVAPEDQDEDNGSRQRRKKGKGYESEYVRMVKWMTKWVGRHNTPGRNETQRALQRVRWFRDLQAFKPLKEDGHWSHM